MSTLITPDDRISWLAIGYGWQRYFRALERARYHQPVASRSELDLLDGSAVEAWFAKQKPTVVVLAAAKVRHFGQQQLSG